MTFAHFVQKARTDIAEIVEVTRIGMALQQRRITAEQASVAISKVGASPQAIRTDTDGGARELVNA